MTAFKVVALDAKLSGSGENVIIEYNSDGIKKFAKAIYRQLPRKG